MSQKRLIDFGAGAEASKFKEAWSKLFAPGVLTGYDFTVTGTSTFSASAGSAIVPNGTIIVDDDDITFSIPITVGAQDYTVIYTHEDQKILGGAPATASVISGLVSTWPDSVILGWVEYPGGAVALDASHLVQAPKAQVTTLNTTAVEQTSVFLPPFSQLFADSVGANMTISNDFDTTPNRAFHLIDVDAVAPGPEDYVVFHQLVAEELTPQNLSFEFEGSTSSSLAIELFDTSGSAVTLSTTTLVGTGSLTEQSLGIEDGTFTSGDIYYLKLTFTVDVGTTLKFAKFTVSKRFLPF